MLKAIFENKDNKLTLKLEGHAGQAEAGHDLVCASCSILAYTVAKLIKAAEDTGDLKAPAEIILESGDSLIVCEPKEDSYRVIFGVYMYALVGYDLLAKNYPQYVDLEQFGMV